MRLLRKANTQLGMLTALGAALVALSASCTSADKRRLALIAEEDTRTRFEILEQIRAANPGDAAVAAQLAGLREKAQRNQVETAKTLGAGGGWVAGAIRVANSSFGAHPPTDEIRSRVAMEREYREVQIRFGRALQALELQEIDLADSQLDSMRAPVLFPSSEGVRNQVAARRRMTPILQLEREPIEPGTLEFVNFLRESQARDEANASIEGLLERERDVVDAQRFLREAKEALAASDYEEALGAILRAIRLDGDHHEYREAEAAIREAWAISVYTEAIALARTFTKKNLAGASERFGRIDGRIIPGYRQTVRWKEEVDKALAQVFVAEARDCLRSPALQRIATAVACLEQAVSWDPTNREAYDLLNVARTFEDLAVGTKLEVSVTGETDWAAEFEARLIRDLEGAAFRRISVQSGRARYRIDQLATRAAQLDYAPYPNGIDVPWPVLELHLKIHEDEATREGDEMSVGVSSARASGSANRTVTNPDYHGGSIGQDLIQRTLQLLESDRRPLEDIHTERRIERDRTKELFRQAFARWEIFDRRREDAQRTYNTAEREYESANMRLAQASALLSAAQDVLRGTPRTITISTSGPGGTPIEQATPNPNYTNAEAGVRNAEAAKVAAEQALANAEQNLKRTELELATARREEERGRLDRDERNADFDAAEASFQLADEPFQFHIQWVADLEQLLREATAQTQQPARLPHEYWEAYQYRTGSAGVRARVILRGWLLDTRGNVVLQPFIEEHANQEQDSFVEDVAPQDRLNVAAKQSKISDVNTFHNTLRQSVYTSVLNQARQTLERNAEGNYQVYQTALAQNRKADALEHGLRYLSYMDDAQSLRAEPIRAFVDATMMEVLP